MSKLPNTPPSLKAWEDGWCEISLTDQESTLIEENSFLDLHFRSSLRFYCSICRVPLCITPLGKSSPANTCFKKWHNSVNLKRESKRKQQALIKWKQGN